MASRAWPFGVYPAGGLARLSSRVVAYYADGGPLSNSAIVSGSEATLVFDPNVIRFARTLRAAADGPPLRDLVISHAHSDHAYGIAHFVPPAEAWTRRYLRDGLEFWSGEGLARHAEEYRAYGEDLAAEMLAAHVVAPGHVVEAPAAIELGGGVRVLLRPEAEAHTVADRSALVEPDGVVLCGDLWFNDFEPYFGAGSLSGSLTALRHLREAGGGTNLPGHGLAAPLPASDADRMERLIGMSDQVAAGIARGLRGDRLTQETRRAFETQRTTPGGIDFASRWPGFLEEGVEKAEADLAEG
jgi:glyoxylase-like metal-dependent hydrolase (beta-lactamase superfamily II)